MNFFPRPLAEWFQGLRKGYFFAAIRVTAEEAASDLEAESIDIKKRRATQFLEALDFINQLPTNQDKHKERALDLLREDLLDVRNITHQVLSGRITFAEGRESLQGLPPESGSSGTSLPVESKPTARPALPNGKSPEGPKTPPPPTAPADMPPPKKKRGRPYKYPRPEANGNGPMNESSPQDPSGPES